jgi:hypothetical protein
VDDRIEESASTGSRTRSVTDAGKRSVTMQRLPLVQSEHVGERRPRRSFVAQCESEAGQRGGLLRCRDCRSDDERRPVGAVAVADVLEVLLAQRSPQHRAGTDGRFGRGVPARRQLVALAAKPRRGAHHARPPSHFLKTQGIEDAVIQSYSGHATRQSRQDARVAL